MRLGKERGERRGLLTWPCWGESGGDSEEREGMLEMEGVPGMVRLGRLCVPACTATGPGALKKPCPSRPMLTGSDAVSFIPAPHPPHNVLPSSFTGPFIGSGR